MSSLRNAVKRKTHKERSQLSHRKHLGLLEKKKDYKLRADDFHRKERRLRALHQRADFRNPEEFYFKMVNTKTKDGIHVVEKEHVDEEVKKLIRSQNIGYLRMRDEIETSKIRKLRERLHFLGELGGNVEDSAPPPPNTHTVFLSDGEDDDDDDDDEDEDGNAGKTKAPVNKASRAIANFDKAKFFDTTEAFADRAYNRPRTEQLQQGQLLVSGDKDALKAAAKARRKAYAELEARLNRQDKLRRAMAHMEMHKKLSGKGRRMKISDGGVGAPAVYKWKAERKR
ncbi:U3 small nucleolar RNA-associated protein 11 [Hondaea fermentalgiana]|uniref:U3 small nucleolar RNA-associated protein 11 n=1 Tax=Hondaea fermentalgiana TaxID=2315210 RepID=A0A2R5GD79_9STRA|nr:U3 small nucleolar RNA-associated protein 11 [Hondaea fermentalgiana]|eukprot:GBG28505.1 U3 small nucleolar RNA-associated protein 11 [Hondaea fermentalgiana]